MLKFKVELDLGNEAMLTIGDVNVAWQRTIADYLREHAHHWRTHLVEGDGGVLHDENGNRVGVWGVERTDREKNVYGSRGKLL